MSAAITESGMVIPRYLVEPRPIKPIDFCHRFQREFKHIAFYEIVEGTSIYAFFQDGDWRLSCDDDKSLSNVVASFKDTCEALNVDLERDLDKNFTYSFVFQTPYYKYVNSFLNSYEIYIDAIYRYSENDTLIPCNLEDFTAYKFTYDVACYQKNRRILFPQKLIPNFDNLYLIVKEWGLGDGLPMDILDNDDYDRHKFIHKRSEKGIAMVHIPSGTTSIVLNRHFLKYAGTPR